MRIYINLYEGLGYYTRWIAGRIIDSCDIDDIKEEDIVEIFKEDGCILKVNGYIDKRTNVGSITLIFRVENMGDIWKGLYKLDKDMFKNCVGEKIRKYIDNENGC